MLEEKPSQRKFFSAALIFFLNLFRDETNYGAALPICVICVMCGYNCCRSICGRIAARGPLPLWNCMPRAERVA